MICPKCGAHIPHKSDCCLECGTKIDKKHITPKAVVRLGWLFGIIVCVTFYFIALNTPIILFNLNGSIVVFLAILIGFLAGKSIENIIITHEIKHVDKEECGPEIKRMQIGSIVTIIVIVMGLSFGILQIIINGGV